MSERFEGRTGRTPVPPDSEEGGVEAEGGGLMAKKAASTRAKSGSKGPSKAVAEELSMSREAPAALPTHPAPVAMSAILGQDRAVSVLQGVLASTRVHHAWIFHGPCGVGKFTAALAFAALLLDPETSRTLSGQFEADPESKVQRLLRAGTHPDLHVITKELAAFSEDKQTRDGKQITIAKDVIDQHLIRPAAMAPSMRNGARASKVFIVDEAELLDRSPTNAPTQNAILKTLEEPPAGTVIILVTTSPERLLPTIRSRCQQVAFTPLREDVLKAWMNGAKREELAELPTEEIAWLVTHAAGSPGELLAAARGKLYTWQQQLDPMLAAAMRGHYVLELGPAMARLVDELATATVEKNKNASKDAANRDAAEQMFRLVSEVFRKQIRRGAAGGGASAGVEREDPPAVRAVELVREAQRMLEANVNQGFVFEWLSSQISEAHDVAAAR